MRIAVPIHSFEPGGVERVALRLAEAWQEAGAEVAVVLGRDRGATRNAAPRLTYLTRPEPIPTARWETPWLIWHLWRTLRRTPADVIFCAGNTYTVVCVAMKLLLGRRCPPVVVKISNALDRPDMAAPVRAGYRLWLRIQGFLLDLFVATAPPMADEAATAIGGRPVVIPNPILKKAQIDRTAAARRAREGRRFVAVGRLEPQKNYPLMLSAFARIAGPHDRLDIAGSGGERTRIAGLIERLGLAGRVTLMGHVADVGPMLAEADALVLSSDYEGLPGAVVEALAAGVPIAATDCCASMRWLLGDERFGALAPPGDASGLAAAMEEAIGLAPEVPAMRAFASQFTLEQSAPRYLALFAELVADLPPNAPPRPPGCGTIDADRNAAC
ncbi:glycosyltransferase [Qipengyuania sediminis]|uniref:glycosyltransferase n=1 Tax=Qipengyuania sediminis TaxID=1532023 RepID=UPI00140477EC|nr:glycosyltransferase [Qipengyuania sediminis]